MSRILKSPYINFSDDNIIIKNDFNIEQYNETKKTEAVEKKQQLEENKDIEQNKDIDQNKNLEEYQENIKEEILEMARIQAETIIENAKKEAKAIIENAEKEMTLKAEEIYDTNITKAYNDGINKVEKECSDIKKEAIQILEEANIKRENLVSEMEPEIVNFIIDTTQNILTNAYKFNPNIISLIIKKGLNNIKKLENIKIRISNNNYEILLKNKDELIGRNIQESHIDIIEDENLGETDCIIETDFGEISCGIEEQFSSLKEALYHILN